MNPKDWCELTETFQPLEHMEDVLKVLGKVRVFSTDDDRLYVFTDAEKKVEHVAYRVARRRWICACGSATPCPAVAVMQIASFSWTIEDDEED